MRFVLPILVSLSPVTAIANPGGGIMQQHRAPSEKPHVPAGLEAAIYAQGLGEISALHLGPDGELFTLDKQHGRLFSVKDLDGDGRVDMRRTLVRDFSRPSGLTMHSGALYVADENAVWKVDILQGTKTAIASLANVDAQITPRLLSADERAGLLTLTLNYSNGTHGRFSINADTGYAKRLSTAPGRISTLARTANGELWIGSTGSFGPAERKPDGSSDILLETLAPVSGMILPGQFGNLPGGFENWNEHILVANGVDAASGAGLNIIAIPTKFGEASGEGKPFIEGFVRPHRRSAWGAPGAMSLNSSGLYIADQWNGTVWRVSKPSPSEQPKLILASAKTEIETEPTDLETQRPADPNSFERVGSQITEGSQIKTGSTLIDKWKAERAQKREESRQRRMEKSEREK